MPVVAALSGAGLSECQLTFLAISVSQKRPSEMTV